MANTPWCGWTDDKLYLQSGVFSATIKDSQYIGGVASQVWGISWDGSNTPFSGNNKLFLQSGQFTSTLKTSEDISEVIEVAYYTLEIELSTGDDRYVKLVNVNNHLLRSGFLVVEYAGGEQWFRASDVTRVTKSYM